MRAGNTLDYVVTGYVYFSAAKLSIHDMLWITSSSIIGVPENTMEHALSAKTVLFPAQDHVVVTFTKAVMGRTICDVYPETYS